jgi:hypothetical protein
VLLEEVGDVRVGVSVLLLSLLGVELRVSEHNRDD